MKRSFILWLLNNNMANKIFMLGFVFAFIGYSFWKPIGDILKLTEEGSYQVHFICVSISFFFYTFAYFLSKYDKWRWYPMFVTLICFSRVVQEMFYPELAQTYQWLEYFNFVLTFFIVVFYYVKHQRTKFKEDERGNLEGDKSHTS